MTPGLGKVQWIRDYRVSNLTWKVCIVSPPPKLRDIAEGQKEFKDHKKADN